MKSNYELKCFLHVPISIGEDNIVRHKSKIKIDYSKLVFPYTH